MLTDKNDTDTVLDCETKRSTRNRVPVRKTRNSQSKFKKKTLPTNRQKYKRSQEIFEQLFMNDDKVKFLNEAAFLSRMPNQKITALESYYFSNLVESNAFTRNLYVTIRNHILHIWLSNPKIELTIESLLNDHENNSLKPPLNCDEQLVRKVHRFLERFGLINFGLFEILTNPTINNYHVIIVGAGIAGLSAANQLTRFGFCVTVLEGRDRIGGRILTFRKNDYIADLGAMVVTGLGGNPVSVISEQINMELHTILQGCPLYDSNGILIDKLKDELVEKEFNRILEATSQMSHRFDLNYFHNEPLSLGDAFDSLMTCEQIRVLDSKIQYLNELNELKSQLNQLHSQLLQIKEKSMINFQCCRLFAGMKDCSSSLASYGHYRKLLKALIAKEKQVYCDMKAVKQQIHHLENTVPA